MDLTAPLPTEKDIPLSPPGEWPTSFIYEWKRQISLLPGRMRWPRWRHLNTGWLLSGEEVPSNHPQVVFLSPMGWFRRVIGQLGMGMSGTAALQNAFIDRLSPKLVPLWMEEEEGKKKKKNPYNIPFITKEKKLDPNANQTWNLIWTYLKDETTLLFFLREWEEDRKRVEMAKSIWVNWVKPLSLPQPSVKKTLAQWDPGAMGKAPPYIPWET